MSTSHPFRFAVLLVILGTTSLFAISAYGDTNDTLAKESLASETLDVNLNSIYLKERSQKGSSLLNEIILQWPYPISETAKKTGQGPFGGITYFDDKTFANTNTQHSTVLGLGRIYYSTSVPGDTPRTFIPYLTWYRAMFIDYKDPTGQTVEGKTNSWLTPGFMYAYRMEQRVVLHLDMEAYSYSKMDNNRARMGFSYMPKWPMIISASYERVSWDLNENIGASDFFMKGDSGEFSAKIIVRNPPQGNFSLILGYGTLHNA
ncbi:MAG: hypothetical protein WCA63_11580, partial [Gallionella sp.]